jgi:putative ABC transport system permease protein
MSLTLPAGARPRSTRPVAVTFALRELASGLRGFYIFLACIALGVASIAGVGSFARGLVDGLGREGRVILGGDLSATLVQREATAAERAFLEASGARIGTVATLRAMARSGDGQTALVEAKAVDATYPQVGTLTFDPPQDRAAALDPVDGRFGAAADTALMARLNLKIGDTLRIGEQTFVVRATLVNEPDKLAGGIGFGPRLMVSEAGLRATGLLQPGSLIRWHYRLTMPPSASVDADARAFATRLQAQFPDAGFEVRTRTNASPQLARNIERFTQFLTLVGLTALLVGGVGVANAVKSYLDRKRDSIATLKALGATGGRVFGIFLVHVMVIGAIGVGIGLAVGAALPFVVAWIVADILPVPIEPSIYPSQLGLSFVYGMLTALAFAIWPLGRAHDVPVSALFRDHVAPERRFPRWRYIIATVLAVAALAALSVVTAYDRRIAMAFLAAAAGVFLLLRLVAFLVMWIAARVPRPRGTELRMAVANMHRPGALTPTVVLSLGLGLSLLVTLGQIGANLRQQLTDSLPERAPAFFFVDIPNADTARFDSFVQQQAGGGTYNRVPMMRGRIVSVNGVDAADIKAQPNVNWVLRGDRGVTYAAAPPEGSSVVRGEWWAADYSGPPLVSFDQEIADGLGLNLGDRIVVNVLGRNIEARVANVRSIDWRTIGINFVMVFSPNTFRGAPHTHLATLTPPPGTTTQQEIAVVRAVADAFPSVATVRVKDALEAVNRVVADLNAAIRGASAVALIAAVLVLAGALAAGNRQRIYDAVILKTVGATRGRLIYAFVLEYGLIGLATALCGVLAGSLSAYFVVTGVMNLTFTWMPWAALTAAFGALVVTIVLGLIGTWTVLGQKPAPILRSR